MLASIITGKDHRAFSLTSQAQQLQHLSDHQFDLIRQRPRCAFREFVLEKKLATVAGDRNPAFSSRLSAVVAAREQNVPA